MRRIRTDTPVDALLDEIAALPDIPGRRLIAIAGGPASGKSTLAEALVAALNARNSSAVLVPMDGYHLDNDVLDDMGMRHRKGAPETFDAAGFADTVKMLKSAPDIALPTFNRAFDKSVPNSIHVTPSHRIVVLEGNYLCLDETPWSDLADYWDLSVYLDVSLDVTLLRLVQRWLDHGLSPKEATERAKSNDMANARRVAENLGPVDIWLQSDLAGFQN